MFLHCVVCCLISWATHGLPADRAPVYRGCPCRDPLGCPLIPRQDGIRDKAPTLLAASLTAVLQAEAVLIVLPQTHTLGRMHVSWISADLGSTLCRCERHAHEFSSFCTTLTTSGKLFDSTPTRKIPGCPHSIRHISLIVKVGNSFHLRAVGEILSHLDVFKYHAQHNRQGSNHQAFLVISSLSCVSHQQTICHT